MIKLKSLIENREWTDKEYDFYEQLEEAVYDVIVEFKNRKPNQKYQPWRVVNFNRLYKIWNDFVKTGVVRDERGMDEIEAIILTNILKLNANTILMNHTQVKPDEYWEQAWPGWENMSEEEKEQIMDQFIEYVVDPVSGQWRISDYAMERLFQLASKLLRQNDYDQKLYLIDRILNITHQRSQLASWFVEGGRRSLSKLSGTEEYFEPEEWEKR